MGNKQNKSNRNVANDDAQKKEQIKMLLLGTIFSGKSTIFKAMLFSHNLQYHFLRNHQWFIAELRQNCAETIRKLLKRSVSNGDPLSDIQQYCTAICNIDSYFDDINTNNIQTLAHSIHCIWNLDAIRRIYQYRTREQYWFRTFDNMEHFFDKIHEIMNVNYEATQQDILMSSIRTTGCYEEHFEDEQGTQFTIYDVGGQRTEQKKWWRCFDGVQCILFVCALNGYCTPTIFPKYELQINECLDEWDMVSNQKCFNNVQKVLLLNKTDLFRKCLQATPLTVCFGDEYKGKNYHDFPSDCNRKIYERLIGFVTDDIYVEVTHDVIGIIESYCDVYNGYWLELVYRDGIEFITQKFLKFHSNAVVYEVCGIDTDNVKQIIQRIKAQIFPTIEFTNHDCSKT